MRLSPPSSARLALGVIAWGGLCTGQGLAQSRDSLAGERSAQALKEALDAETFNLEYGPVRFRTGAELGLSYTDNVFYSQSAEEDLLVRPELSLEAVWPVSDLNALRFSLGLAYEWYLEHDELNGDAPFINPGTELVFHLFAGDFRIQLHDRFSYQESLFFNGFTGSGDDFFNLNNVGTFARFDNEAGFRVDWDLNRVIVTSSFNHENFISNTGALEYLTRTSEWLEVSAGWLLGDGVQAGLEARTSWHDYEEETVLNDHWRLRSGPFIDLTLMEGFTLRAGGGYDLGRFEPTDVGGSDYDSFYGYARVGNETRWFAHALTAGHEHLLGSNANNLQTTYVRYSISSDIVRHLDLTAALSVNFAEEFGGAYEESFTYYGAGLRAGTQFHKYWRADLEYEFRRKDSDQALVDFDRNRVTLSVTFRY